MRSVQGSVSWVSLGVIGILAALIAGVLVWLGLGGEGAGPGIGRGAQESGAAAVALQASDAAAIAREGFELSEGLVADDARRELVVDPAARPEVEDAGRFLWVSVLGPEDRPLEGVRVRALTRKGVRTGIVSVAANTGPDGRARLELEGLVDAGGVLRGGVDELGVSATFQDHELLTPWLPAPTTAVWLAGRGPDFPEVVLRGPASGGARFIFDPVTTANGTPVEGVMLVLTVAGPGIDSGWGEEPTRTTWIPVTPGSGVVNAPTLPLGVELRAELHHESALGPLATGAGTVPDQPGERATVRLEPRDGAPELELVTGKAIAMPGEDASDRSLQLMIQGPDGQVKEVGAFLPGSPDGMGLGNPSESAVAQPSIQTRTRVDGSFTFVVPRGLLVAGQTVALQEEWFGDAPPFAVLRPIPSGFDVGTVQLGPEEAFPQPPPQAAPERGVLLISGRVFDQFDDPIAGVTIAPRARSKEEMQASSTDWNWLARVKSGVDGSYAVYGPERFLQGELLLTASHPDCRGGSTSKLTPGPAAVDLTLTRLGDLEFELYTDAWVDARVSLEVLLKSREAERAYEAEIVGVYGRYGVILSQVPPGRYRFEVRLRDTRVALRTVQIQIEPGVRLAPIDLRGQLVTCSVAIQTPDGRVMPINPRASELANGGRLPVLPNGKSLRVVAVRGVGDVELTAGLGTKSSPPASLVIPASWFEAPGADGQVPLRLLNADG